MTPKRILQVLVAAQAVWLSGCTVVLWERDRFAHSYQPAQPPNLKLYYSTQRQDVLVTFDEVKEGKPPVRCRAYWMEENLNRIDNQRKPRFVPLEEAQGLTQVPVFESTPQPGALPAGSFYGNSTTNIWSFTLCSDGRTISEQKLPTYYGDPSRRVAQVGLTPFTLAVDATIIGAVLGYYFGPQLAEAFSRNP